MFTYSVEVGAREIIREERNRSDIPSTKMFFFRVLAAVLFLVTMY